MLGAFSSDGEGEGVQRAVVCWSEEVGADGYAGAAEQLAMRAATEATGSVDAQDFWLGFDLSFT